MNARLGFCRTVSLLGVLLACAVSAAGEERQIPAALEPWKDWATWGDLSRDCPATYANGDDRMCFWPSTLTLRATPRGGSFSGKFTVFGAPGCPCPAAPTCGH